MQMEINSRKALYSEHSPPVDVSDVLMASFPLYSMTEMSRRQTQFIAALDKDILDPLHKVGCGTNLGYEGTGLMPLILQSRRYYIGELVVQFKLIPMNTLLQTLERANLSEKRELS